MLLLFCRITGRTQKAFLLPLSTWPVCKSEAEFSRTSLAVRTSSRTHFEVLGLGLEASSPQKLACPRLEDSSIFWIVKILWSARKIFWKTYICGDRLKNFCEDLFFFFGDRLKNFCEDLFFWRALALVSLVLGLGLESVCPRKGCPWPRPRIFLCPWPWPRALCPRLHLCCVPYPRL